MAWEKYINFNVFDLEVRCLIKMYESQWKLFLFHAKQKI